MIHRSKQHGKGQAYSFFRAEEVRFLKKLGIVIKKSLLLPYVATKILISKIYPKTTKYYRLIFSLYRDTFFVIYFCNILIDKNLKLSVMKDNWLNN